MTNNLVNHRQNSLPLQRRLPGMVRISPERTSYLSGAFLGWGFLLGFSEDLRRLAQANPDRVKLVSPKSYMKAKPCLTGTASKENQTRRAAAEEMETISR